MIESFVQIRNTDSVSKENNRSEKSHKAQKCS